MPSRLASIHDVAVPLLPEVKLSMSPCCCMEVSISRTATLPARTCRAIADPDRPGVSANTARILPASTRFVPVVAAVRVPMSRVNKRR